MQFSCKRNIKAIYGDRINKTCVCFLTLWMSITNITGAPGLHTLHKSDHRMCIPSPLCLWFNVVSRSFPYSHRFNGMSRLKTSFVVEKSKRKWENELSKVWNISSYYRITRQPKKNHGIRTTKEIAPLIHCSGISSRIRIAILFDNIARLINSRYNDIFERIRR